MYTLFYSLQVDLIVPTIVQGVIIQGTEFTFSTLKNKNLKSFFVKYGFNGYHFETLDDKTGQLKVGNEKCQIYLRTV